MQKHTAQILLRVIAILSAIYALFLMVTGAVMAFSAEYMARLYIEQMAVATLEELTSVILVLGIVMGILGLIYAAAAVGVWMRMKWGKILMIMLSFFNILIGVLWLSQRAWIGAIVLILNGAILYLLLFDRSVADQFLKTQELIVKVAEYVDKPKAGKKAHKAARK
jgi:hypothetical protein